MSLLTEQIAFQRDLRCLMDYIELQGCTFSIGEVMRPIEMQEIYVKKGKSLTMNSMHLKKLAADIYIFKEIDGKYVLLEEKEDLFKFGDYWESLNPKNEWGGNWESIYDSPHFERKVL